MRARYVVASFVAVFAALLAGCSSSTKGSGSGGTSQPNGGTSTGSSAAAGGSGGGGNAVLCGQLVKAAQELGNASGAIANPSTAKAAFDNAIAKLKLIGSGAPANVSSAVSELISALQAAESAYANPQAPDVSKLQALTTKLPADLQTISSYVDQSCAGFHS